MSVRQLHHNRGLSEWLNSNLHHYMDSISTYRQIREQFGEAYVLHGVIIPACGVAESACNIGLPGTRGTDQKDISALSYIRAGCKRGEKLSVQISVRVVFDTFHACVAYFQPGVRQEAVHKRVPPPGVFGLHQHSEALLEGERFHRRIPELLSESVGHAAELHFVQFVHGVFLATRKSPKLQGFFPSTWVGIFLTPLFA